MPDLEVSDQIRVNGEKSRSLDVMDRGLCYGDGLFETIKVFQNKPLLLDTHFIRLALGCERLGIPFEGLKERFEADIHDLLTASGHPLAVLKLTVTRGSGPRGYFSTNDLLPTTISSLSLAPDFTHNATEGVALRWCHTPLSINPLLAGIKHLNRLEQVLARKEWESAEISEGLMKDADGFLIEGTMSNLFWVQEGRLYTPALDRCGIDGVVRQTVIDIAARQNIPVVIGRFTETALCSAEEIFMCNSLIDIWPVRKLGTMEWKIGSLTRRLQALLKEEYSV